MNRIAYSKAAAKTLAKMPSATANRIRSKIEAFAADPASQAKNVKALTGYEEIRLRVGDWQVIMNDRGEVLQVIKVAPRGGAY